MQPLIPYLMGIAHPYGTRLCDYQKCIRTNDLEEIGEERIYSEVEIAEIKEEIYSLKEFVDLAKSIAKNSKGEKLYLNNYLNLVESVEELFMTDFIAAKDDYVELEIKIEDSEYITINIQDYENKYLISDIIIFILILSQRPIQIDNFNKLMELQKKLLI